MHTSPNSSISTVDTLTKIQDAQQPKQANKIGFVKWAKSRCVKAWPVIKYTLIIGGLFVASTAAVAGVVGAGVGLVALYAAGYHTLLSVLAVLIVMLAIPPILIISLCCQGVAG